MNGVAMRQLSRAAFSGLCLSAALFAPAAQAVAPDHPANCVHPAHFVRLRRAEAFTLGEARRAHR